MEIKEVVIGCIIVASLIIWWVDELTKNIGQ